MRRLILILWGIFLTLYPIIAQDNDAVKNISELLAKDPEELTDEELEHFSGLIKRNVYLNKAKRDELEACGIFTRYQVASLMDYRDRSGPCLSYLELATLDGFSEEFVKLIQSFVSLEFYDEQRRGMNNEVTARASLRSSYEQTRYGYTTRYKLKIGDALKTSLACSRSLDSEGISPDAICGSIEVRMRKFPVSVVAGDFNARFGQGLALWTGSDFTSLNSPSAFMRRHFGVTPSTSYTGNNTLTGMATEFTIRNLSLSAYLAMPGIKTLKSAPQKLRLQPAVNLNYAWRFGQAGVSHVMDFGGLGREMYIPTMKTSFDLSMCVQGVDVFSELMFDWVAKTPSAVAGVVFPVKEIWSMAALVRSYESEHKLALSGSLNTRKHLSGTFSTEMTLYSIPKDKNQDMSAQLKFHTQWQYAMTEQFHITVRLTERVRSWGQLLRSDLRSDLSWKSDSFIVTMRLNALQCDNYSFLSYVEGGYKHAKLSVYIRQGIFFVDDWDDRIYAYERDVPGAYNSPAFYGRGLWTSLMSSWKVVDWCRLYFRAGYTSYPFMTEKKPGKAELRFQSIFDF